MNYEPKTITLTPDDLPVVTRPVNGGGGMQGLLRPILQKLNRQTGTATISAVEETRIRKYADYCPGGYEDRFKALRDALDRAGKK